MNDETMEDKYLADAYIEGKIIQEKFIKDYGQDAFDTVSQDENIYESMEAVRTCGHQCSSNCRREGCGCQCGEHHFTKL